MRSAPSVRRIAKVTLQRDESLGSGCVLDLWDQGVGGHESCAAAVARLIVAQPERVSAFAGPTIVESSLRGALIEELASAKPSNAAFWLSAIAQFLDWKGRSGEAADVYRETLDRLKKTHGPDHAETLAVFNELDRLLRRMGREKEACRIGHELRVAPLLARNDEGSLLALRDLAFNALASGCLAEAEAIYRHLLVRNFEPAGTHCHLAPTSCSLSGATPTPRRK